MRLWLLLVAGLVLFAVWRYRTCDACRRDMDLIAARLRILVGLKRYAD